MQYQYNLLKKLPYNLQLFASEEDTNQEEEEMQEDTDEKKDDNQEEEKEEKTFTQKQVNRMMAREKRQGKKAIMKELGIEGATKSEIEEFLKWKKEQKTEEEKQQEEVAKAAKEKSEAEKRALKAEIKAEALGAGVNKKYIDDVTTLVLSKVSEDVSVEDAVAEIKENYDVFFAAEEKEEDEPAKNKKGKKGTGILPNEDKKPKNKNSLGARLAANKNNKKTGSKFFG